MLQCLKDAQSMRRAWIFSYWNHLVFILFSLFLPSWLLEMTFLVAWCNIQGKKKQNGTWLIG